MKKNPKMGVKALFEPDAILDLAEEYANAGLNKIKQWMNEYPQDPDGYEAIIKGLIKENIKIIFSTFFPLNQLSL